MKKTILSFYFLIFIFLKGYSQTSETVDYDFLYYLFGHCENHFSNDAGSGYEGRSGVSIKDVSLAGINLNLLYQKSEICNSDNTPGYSSDFHVYSYKAVSVPTISYKLEETIYLIDGYYDEICDALIVANYTSSTLISEKTEKDYFSWDDAWGYMRSVTRVRPLLLVDLTQEHRFNKINDPLVINLSEKTEDNLSHVNTSNIPDEMIGCDDQLSQLLYDRPSIQVSDNGTTWHTVLSSYDLFVNHECSISYNVLVSAFGSANFVGKECFVRVNQRYIRSTPKSFYYFPKLEINTLSKVAPKCSGDNGNIQCTLKNVPASMTGYAIPFLYSLYRYKTNPPANSLATGADAIDTLYYTDGTLPKRIYFETTIKSGNLTTFSLGDILSIPCPAGIYKLKIYLLSDNQVYLPSDTVFELKDPQNISVNLSPANNWNGYHVPTEKTVGRVNVLVSNGTPPYKYTFNSSLIPQNFSPLPTSNPSQINCSYNNNNPVTIYVSDANNCPKASDSSPFLRAPDLNVSEIPETIETSCNHENGGGNGEFSFDISGGVGKYNVLLYYVDENKYVLSDYSTTQTHFDIYYLALGDYALYISDITDGVIKFYEFSVVEPPPLSIDSVTFSDINCFGDSVIASMYTNSESVMMYNCWRTSPFESYINQSGIFKNLAPGTEYYFSYDDMAGCFGPTITVTTPENNYAPIVNAPSFTESSCANAANGIIEITPSGGTPAAGGYKIEQTYPPISDNTYYISKEFTDREVGMKYEFQTTDGNGCIQTDTFSAGSISDTLKIAGINTTDAYCESDNHGSLTVSINPGGRPTGNYTYTLLDNEMNEVDIISDTSGTSAIFNQTPGIYLIQVHDNANCSYGQSATINIDPDEIRFNTASQAITNTWCAGVSTGSIAIEAIGGFPAGHPYTYTLHNIEDGSDKDTITSGGALFNALREGTYNLIVSDEAGCQDMLTDLTVDIAGTPIYVNYLNVDDQYCDEQPVSLSISTGSTSGNIKHMVMTYPNNTTDTLSKSGYAGKEGLLANINAYEIRITDDIGCFKDTVFTIDHLHNDPRITISILDSAACNSATNGKIEVSADQPIITGDLAFTLGTLSDTAGASVIFDNLRASLNYTLTVIDTMGCQSDSSFAFPGIALPVNISAFDLVPASCARAANASVQLQASGSIPSDPGYYFVLNNSDTLTGANVSFANYPVGGTNRVRVFDKYGCKDSTSVFAFPVLTDSLNISVEAVTDASCPGYADGVFHVLAHNGKPFPAGYLYRVIDQADQSETIKIYDNSTTLLEGIPSGTYNIEITDADNCLVLTEDVRIHEPSPPTLLANAGYVAQKGDTTGWIDAQIAQGNEKYYIEWYSSTTPIPSNLISSDTSTGNSTISGLPAGTYLVRIEDTAKCLFWDDEWLEAEVEVIEPEDSLRLELQELIPVSCNGLSDGQFILHTKGGWGDSYRYGTDPADISSLSPTFDGVPAGTAYTFYSKDTAGVIASATFEMIEPEILTASVDEIVHANCFGSGDGVVVLTIQGGNDSYYVSTDQTNWIDGNQMESLSAGDYTIYVKDNKNCQTSAGITINEPTAMAIADTVIVNTQCQVNEGSIMASVEGGTPEYDYAWYDGSTFLGGGSPSIENLYSGVYTLQVIDKHDCHQEFNFYITDLTNLEIASLSTNPVSCWDGNDGSASVEIQNGFPPYEIIWPDSSTSGTIAGLPAGTYLLSIYDAEGCKVFENFTIGSPDSLSIHVDELLEPLCPGVADGSLEVSAHGGTPDYTYDWGTGRNRPGISNIGAGALQLTVTDANNCAKNFVFNINYAEEITTSLPDDLVICHNNIYPLDPGSFEYVYWYQDDDYVSSEQVLNVSKSGKYMVEVEDSRGCQGSDTIMVRTSETDLGAQFLMASIVQQNDTLVVFEASDPIPDSICLFVDKSIITIDSGQYFRYLMPTDTGSFEITLISYLNDCQDIISKTLTVLSPDEEEDPFKSTGTTIIRSAKLYPNPTDGNFSLELELNKANNVTLRMVSFGDGSTLLIRNLKDSNYYIEPFDLEGLLPGTYLLSIQTSDEMQTLKVIIY